MDRLRVTADEAFATSHAVGNDAEELRDGLSSLAQGWENLLHGWSGAASSAYATIWEEWHDGATRLIDALAESSHRLGAAAVRYGEQDATSAEALDSSITDLGL